MRADAGRRVIMTKRFGNVYSTLCQVPIWVVVNRRKRSSRDQRPIFIAEHKCFRKWHLAPPANRRMFQSGHRSMCYECSMTYIRLVYSVRHQWCTLIRNRRQPRFLDFVSNSRSKIIHRFSNGNDVLMLK